MCATTKSHRYARQVCLEFFFDLVNLVLNILAKKLFITNMDKCMGTYNKFEIIGVVDHDGLIVLFEVGSNGHGLIVLAQAGAGQALTRLIVLNTVERGKTGNLANVKFDSLIFGFVNQ